MHLQIRLYTGDLATGEINVRIHSFQDIRRVGNDTARAVRNWLRQVPMTPGPKHHQVNLYANWIQDKPNPEPVDQKLAVATPRATRKRKARK